MSHPINQNLISNFNQTRSHPHSDSNKFNNLLQTPKTNSKVNNSLLFSPDEINQTPISAKNFNNYSGKLKYLIKP